jgi:hypothetical protein
MHQLARRVSVTAGATVAAVALAGPCPALGRPAATSSKKAFSGNICSLPLASEVAAANVTGPCVKGKTTRKTSKTPFGSVTQEAFVAHWGSLPLTGPGHFVTVVVGRYTGSASALAYGRSKIRLKVLSHGAPVSISPLASELGDTVSCFNPPKEDCTHASVLGLVKNYVVEVILYDAPPTGVGVTDPGEDEPQDRAQEETDKAPIVSIFKVVAAKL